MLNFDGLFTKFVIAFMVLSLIFSSLSPEQAKALVSDSVVNDVVTNPVVSDVVTSSEVSDMGNELTSAQIEEMALMGYSVEDFNDITEVLATTFGDEAIIFDSEGLMIGYDDNYLADELGDNPLFNGLIETLEEGNVLASQFDPLLRDRITFPLTPTTPGSGLITLPGNPGDSPMLAACDWVGMKDKPSYIKNENNCIIGQVKANFGYVAIGSMIANLIAAGSYKKAGWEIIKLGVKSNIWGVVFTLSWIRGYCIKKMEKMYPGRTNCMSR